MSDILHRDRLTLLTFRAAGRRLALPLADIRRVVSPPLLERPVGCPTFVEGYFDLGGAPVAVIRLDRLLGLGDERLGIYAPLLVLQAADPPVALHVAQVTAIFKTTAGDIQPIRKDETFNACIVGRVSDRGETVYLLSAASLLLAEERAKVATHRATRQARLAALADNPVEAPAHAS